MSESTDEKSLSEQENEARLRAAAALKDSVPSTGPSPGQPEVSALKKHKKNRIMTLSFLALAALLVLAWAGDRVMQHYLHPPQKEAEADKPAESAVAAQKRTGMGLDTHTMMTPDPSPDEAGPATSPQVAAPPPVTRLNKSLALTGAQGDSPRQGSQGSSAALTRKAEQAQATGKIPPDKPAEAPADAPKKPSVIQRITLDPDLYIPVDTYIPCTLQTRFVSDVSGHIGCLISEDVYSASTHVRLIQAGTRARGLYKTGTLKQGQARMFVIWTELRTPDGLKIPVVDSQVVGQLGEAGIDGWIDAHFWERAGNTLLVSIVPDLAAAAADNAPGKDRNTDYTENTRAGVAEIAKSMMENSVNIPPTIYKNQGEIIGMMTGEDIDFSGVYQLSFKGEPRDRH